MGLGDELIAVAEAEALHKRSRKKVRIIDAQGRLRWSPVFVNIPWLVHPDESTEGTIDLLNCPGHRPYIDYGRSVGSRQVLRSTYRPMRGSFRFSPEEEHDAQTWMDDNDIEPGFVAFDPYVKGTFSGQNKAWPLNLWQKVIGNLRVEQTQTVQMTPGDQQTLYGVNARLKTGVRTAMAIMGYAGAVVCSEGFLHHAAASLGVPAVVIWGGRSDPEILGYPEHVNLYVKTEGTPCGSMKKACRHCEDAMGRIHPEDVLSAIRMVRRGQ